MSTLTQKTKQVLRERIIEISMPAFLIRHVCPRLPECRVEALLPGDFDVRTLQNDGTGAATVEIRHKDRTRMYGKLYHDDTGSHAHAVLTTLWENGFGRGHRRQVPEPLGFVEDKRLLLTGSATGESLEERIVRAPDAAMGGVKEAAQWLLKLHGSPVRVGRSDHLWYMVEKLSSRLAKAASSHPAEVERLTDMLDRLSEARNAGLPEEAQVHGQFRPIHVFLDGQTVCVIDLDRSRPFDPAWDLAEFVHRLRTTAYRAHGSFGPADALTHAFLEEYGARRPSVMKRVPFHLGFHVLVSFCRHMAKLGENDPGWDAAVDFYTREFESALRTAGPPATRSARPREAFQSRAGEIMGPGFVEKMVYPAVFGRSYDEDGRPAFEASVSQEDRGTGRLTVRYGFVEGVVFGKRYPPGAEPRSLALMQGLRACGFAEGPYQAPEPIAFLPDYNLLLTRAAPGLPLMSYIGKESPEALEAVRRAARWLVRLHTSPVRIGRPERAWSSLKLFTIIRRLAKAAARAPHEREYLLDKIAALCRLGREDRAGPPPVQVHGRFHHEHIYVSEETVSVIDFDQSLPSDPARDLAEFLAMLRRRTFKQTSGTAAAREQARAFIDEYRAHLPRNTRNLTLYWGAAVLLDLLQYRKRKVRDEAVKAMTAFLDEEFDEVISGALT